MWFSSFCSFTIDFCLQTDLTSQLTQEHPELLLQPCIISCYFCGHNILSRFSLIIAYTPSPSYDGEKPILSHQKPFFPEMWSSSNLQHALWYSLRMTSVQRPRAPTINKTKSNCYSTVWHDSRRCQSALIYTKYIFSDAVSTLPSKLKGNFMVFLDHIHFQTFGNTNMFHNLKELSFVART